MHTRRDAIALLPAAGVGTATLLGCHCFVGQARAQAASQAQAASERARAGDVFLSVNGGPDAAPIEPKDIQPGAPIMAWPMDPVGRIVRNGSRLNKVLLLRLDPSGLSAETRDRAADGIVAYTVICPHTGCDVTGWIADQAILECPCHSSLYNPRDGGAVLGGPAPRPLPALPLKLLEGRITVARPFTSRVGFTQG
ncbi:MAG TPA: Rieske 2Fe-2S domain-containing protein [Xanthobacteraceae bacterium]|nr:Rieske 2Fe-2S domain-containing protein [Xanthobacteraceae bacterium]